MYNNLYDLIVSDIMMPQMDGFEFATAVRKVNKHIPILFMSAKDDLPSKQKGFQLGIDDYMVKPVELAELEMRVRALLRRANIEMERKLTVGNLVLDADAVTAEVDGIEIPVATREFNILYKLLSYPKKTFTRGRLDESAFQCIQIHPGGWYSHTVTADRRNLCTGNGHGQRMRHDTGNREAYF